MSYRLALPVFNGEMDLPLLRRFIKKAIREGYKKWEASDLATLRMLKNLGVEDITADWTLYAFNFAALKELEKMGVRRFVASPENNSANIDFLAECGSHIEFLSAQTTPLFISLSTPAQQYNSSPYRVYRRDGLWVTIHGDERRFTVPYGCSERYDISWSDLC
jgi:collagenase-like PrtC family protease